MLAAALGVIPGCLGTFLVVSLYAHKVLNFPALVTVMIASSGDEAFVMFGEIPNQAILITVGLFFVAIVVGFILNLIFKDKNFMNLKNNMLHNHQVPECTCFDNKIFNFDFKEISFQRALLLISTSLFLFFLIIGKIGEAGWNEEKIILLLTVFIVLFIVATVPEHFLVEHLWKHTIKKHTVKIFLWTFGAILLINLVLPLFDISKEAFEPIAQKYFFIILLIAVLVGFIPESGPNMVFIFLFASGYVPVSILVANSVVQDGHGGLPLLAESPKTFIYSKLINMIVGLIIGIAGFLIGF